MPKRNFDLTRIDGVLGVYLLGATFMAYMSSMVISIVAKSEGVFAAVVLFDTAFYIVLAGAVCLIAGVVLLVLNSQAAENLGVKSDSNTILFVTGMMALTFVSLILYAVVPNVF